jgi:FtsZ-binding cell division protein ZapB
MHIEILHKLQMKVKAYMDELRLNQRAIELQFKNPEAEPQGK